MEDRIVCCCHNVSVRDIIQAIDDGVDDFKTLQDKTGIGTECPPCTEESEQLFQELLQSKR